MADAPPLSNDAAIVLGLAGTAMPFARSREAEAERWLRVLRLHGDVGAALQRLGVGEAPLEGQGGEELERASDEAPLAEDRDVLEIVTEEATRFARKRGAELVGTPDVLLAVMRVYGEDFDRVLREHGTDRDEVLERVGGGLAAVLGE